jgi:HD superfamily phosphodiesterase
MCGGKTIRNKRIIIKNARNIGRCAVKGYNKGMGKITIDREQIRRAFKEYTDAYDVTDEKIRLKIGHTYRVAELCDRIARAEEMPEEDVELAWLLGMLHDVGRFEQLRRYNTFIDSDSIEHAALGADILFGKDRGKNQQENGGEKEIRRYVPEDAEDELIETAIRVHSTYRVPKELDERTVRLSHVLRDADKIDILRVNVEVPLEEIYNTTAEKLRTEMVTPEVLDSFYEHHEVLRSLKRTSVDHVVGHCSLVYELVYPESYRIVDEQGYLWKLMDYRTDNPKTAEQFAEMKKEMKRFLTR